MEAKKTFWAYIRGFIMWVGSSLEDKRGAVSHKRIINYFLVYAFINLCKTPDIPQYVIMINAGLILAIMGLTIPEWFAKSGPLLNGEQIGQLQKP